MIHVHSQIPCLPRDWLRDQSKHIQGTDRLLAAFAEEFKVKCTVHSKFHNLVQFKYNQIEADFSEPVVRQCRGLILDSLRRWNVVAWPMDKFFNHGEGLAANIDWESAKAFEKLDGSLIIMYWYEGSWHVGTSGMPNASGLVHGHAMSFEELFWYTWNERRFKLPETYRRCYTFMFELTSKWNRVVVKHDEPDIRLLAVRSIYSGTESETDWFPEYNPVMGIKMTTVKDAEEAFGFMDPLVQEGYVIRDKAFRRIKVKHPGYVAIHHLKDSFTPRRVLEVIRQGETPELLASFPEWRGTFDRVRAAYDGLAAVLAQSYDEIRDITDRKAFAEKAVKTVHPGTMFSLLDGKVLTVKESLAEMQIDRLMDMLGVRDILVEELQ